MKPMRYEISENNEVLVSHSGLAIAGAGLGHTQLKKQFNQIRVVVPDSGAWQAPT